MRPRIVITRLVPAIGDLDRDVVNWLEADGRKVCTVPEGARFAWVAERLVMAHPGQQPCYIDLGTGVLSPVVLADLYREKQRLEVVLNAERGDPAKTGK